MKALCSALRDLTFAQILGPKTDLKELICGSKHLWVAIESTADFVYVAQVTLYSAALGLANCFLEAFGYSQGCNATGKNHERARWQLLGELYLESVLI